MASSSDANCYVYQFDDTYILVDAGLSYRKIIEKLEDFGLSISNISFVLITHQHSDHSKAIDQITKSTNLSVYCLKNPKKFNGTKVMEENYRINEVNIDVIKTSHDIEGACGFLFTFKDKKILHITDTGYINKYISSVSSNCHAYLIESNYDNELIIENDIYPIHVKKRIISKKGHLSNEDCNQFLIDNIGDNTKYILFAHLSANNNKHSIVDEVNKNIKGINKVILKKDEAIKVEIYAS